MWQIRVTPVKSGVVLDTRASTAPELVTHSDSILLPTTTWVIRIIRFVHIFNARFLRQPLKFYWENVSEWQNLCVKFRSHDAEKYISILRTKNQLSRVQSLWCQVSKIPPEFSAKITSMYFVKELCAVCEYLSNRYKPENWDYMACAWKAYLPYQIRIQPGFLEKSIQVLHFSFNSYLTVQ
jgi:hypothetical protein